MNDDIGNLDNFEGLVINRLSKTRVTVSEDLDKKVFDVFKSNLEKSLQEPVIEEGYFSLMSAADGEETIAVELFDNEMKTKLRVFEAHDGISPYLVEIVPLEGYETLFDKYYGATIIIKAGSKEVLRSTLSDSDFSDFIPRSHVSQKRQSWSYHILTDASKEDK